MSSPAPEALTWKPGPPPLDVPARFDAVFKSGSRRAIRTCTKVCSGGYVECDNSPDMRNIADAAGIVWHFPIPDPPVSAECRAASTGESGP